MAAGSVGRWGLASSNPPLPGRTGESAGADARLEVTLHPKTNYHLALVLIPASALFLLVWPLGGFDRTTTIVGTGVSIAFLLGSVGAVLFLRADRTLVLDSRGIRLVRAGKTVNDIPWANMSRFRFGVLPGRGYPSLPATVFWVHRQDRFRGLSIVETYYSVPPGSVWNAALFTAEMARARGIPVVRKDGLIRDFGP